MGALEKAENVGIWGYNPCKWSYNPTGRGVPRKFNSSPLKDDAWNA